MRRRLNEIYGPLTAIVCQQNVRSLWEGLIYAQAAQAAHRSPHSARSTSLTANGINLINENDARRLDNFGLL